MAITDHSRHRAQGLGHSALGDGTPDIGAADTRPNADEQLGTRQRFDDIPRLRLRVGPRVGGDVSASRMDLHGQVLAGIDELDEEREPHLVGPCRADEIRTPCFEQVAEGHARLRSVDDA